MDQNSFPSSGLFGSYGAYSSSDPSLQVPVTAGTGGSLSPFLNVDPIYLNQGDSQFIIPNGQNRTRGRLELAFSQIGGSCMAGAIYGALNGLRISGPETRELAGRVRMSQMITLVTKQGASSANAIGVVALMYSILGVGLSWSRGTDDEVNTIGAATLTGLLYKSSAGLKTMARAGAVGFGLSSLWCLYHNKDKVRAMIGVEQTQY
ncbi:mitochondrial import inner membrane translocase subunit Tim23-like [Diadema antillarum]|uniref:mitochondrial import inner membrane translocase subunit Tim23-like n=1 Tax=Diadema antillarum TaxID=105358 RepID=UPI003A8408ED